SKRVAALFNTVHDVERIGDHAENLVELAQFKVDNKIVFSNKAIKELKEIFTVVDKVIESSLAALQNDDKEKVKEADKYENMVDDLRDTLRESHIRRLNNNECNVNAGVVFLDIVTNLERIADHGVNIAGIVSPSSIKHKPKM
ncbi:MAG: PhoU domain-containing protein, partial [Lutispora sp.]